MQGYNARMEYWLASSPWYGIILWIIFYSSDYYLTLYCARGFREIGHFQFEGSFELNPRFETDINNLRPISRRHIVLLFACSLMLLIVWWITRLSVSLERTYPLYLGMALLIEVAVHLRHLRNVSLIREIKRNGGVEGQITYKRWFSYRISALELYTLATLFLLISLVTYSLFFLGGAIICYATGLMHNRFAKKAMSSPVQISESKT